MDRHAGLLVETIVNGPFTANCYAVAEEATGRALLVDPGDEPNTILQRVRALNWQVDEIVATHAHIDHVGAVAPLKRALGVSFALHPAEKEWLTHLPAQATMFGLPTKEVPEIDDLLADGQQRALGGLTYEILSTPGHSAGGCCLCFAAAGVVFVGDTLFAGSVGRSDLPGGDGTTLIRSIEDKLLTLDDSVVVYSGHGPSTTIGAERRTNPFLRGRPSRR